MPTFKPAAKFPGLAKLPAPLRGLTEMIFPQDSSQVPTLAMTAVGAPPPGGGDSLRQIVSKVMRDLHKDTPARNTSFAPSLKAAKKAAQDMRKESGWRNAGDIYPLGEALNTAKILDRSSGGVGGAGNESLNNMSFSGPDSRIDRIIQELAHVFYGPNVKPK